MTVQFVVSNPDSNHLAPVAYGFGDARVPCVGETIYADGSDPEFPLGAYRVGSVHWIVGLRGPQVARIYLDRRDD